jgi:flavin-dependent dehydrogenase
MLPAGVARTVERECHAAELNFINHNLHFVTRREEPIVWMTMRAQLDCILAREAQGAGALLMEGSAVAGIKEHADCVDLQTTNGLWRAKFVVASDGANSVVARQAGWSAPQNLIPALECEVTVNEIDFARLSNTARFDFGVVPEGYAWVFPKKEHLSIGVLSMRRGRVNLLEALASYLRLLGIENPIKVDRHGYVIPIRPREGSLARGRIFLTGDAAGLVDPVTAEGITHAIGSGQIAAQSLIDCAFDPRHAASEYQSRLAANILPELRAGRLLAWALYKNPRFSAWLFRAQGRALSELVTDIVMGRRTYVSSLRNPSNYLKVFEGFLR